MASKKTESKSTRKPVTMATSNTPKVRSISSLSPKELTALISKRWGNDGNVIISSSISIKNPKVVATLENLLQSKEVTGYVPEKPGDSYEWALVGINHVQFKVRRNIDVTLPVQVHDKLKVGVKRRSVASVDLDSEENKAKAEILDYFPR